MISVHRGRAVRVPMLEFRPEGRRRAVFAALNGGLPLECRGQNLGGVRCQQSRQWLTDHLLCRPAEQGLQGWTDEGEPALFIQGPDDILDVVGDQAVALLAGLQFGLGASQDEHLPLQLIGPQAFSGGEDQDQAAADGQKQSKIDRNEQHRLAEFR